MITRAICDWAAKSPEKAAIVYDGRPLTYRTFARHIAVARGYFVRRGFLGEGYAVIADEHLLNFWIVGLALRSLGLTTIVIPSLESLGRLDLPNVRCVVANPTHPWAGIDDRCAALDLPLVRVSLAGETALPLDAAGTPYPPGGHILETSGTTGSRKRVLMTPAIDDLFFGRAVDVIGMGRDTALGVFSFPAWTAIGYRWAASAWTVGGTAVIEQGRPLHEALRGCGLTHAVLAPGMLASILAAPDDAFARSESLQLVVSAGAMTQAQIERAKARITPYVNNWLASTEAGGIAFTPLRTPEDLRWHRLVPDRKVEIVDELDRPVPIGETGRVRIGTEGGPACYVDDDAATRRFFKDGFFYPGDLAVSRPDGRIALQGRFTDVINLSGRKISPAPIEDRLCEALGVSAVCLLSMPGDDGEEEAHVVVETPARIDKQRLRSVLEREIRGFRTFHAYQFRTLARNPMGKVLRQEVRKQVLAVRLRADTAAARRA